MPVYIIQAGDSCMVKIGWTGGNVESRRRIFQSGHYEQLRIIRIIETPRGAEGWLHCLFAEYHVRGEWFRFHPTMLTVAIGTLPAVVPVASSDMSQQAQLFREIEAFLSGRKMTETTFGHHAVNDGKFVARLRSGGNITVATIDKVRAYIASASTQAAA